MKVNENNSRHYILSNEEFHYHYKNKVPVACPLCNRHMKLLEGKRPEYWCETDNICAAMFYKSEPIKLDPSDVSNLLNRSHADLPLKRKPKKNYFTS